MTTERKYTYYIVCYVDHENRCADGICEGLMFFRNATAAEKARQSWEANWAKGDYVVVTMKLTKGEKNALYDEVNEGRR